MENEMANSKRTSPQVSEERAAPYLPPEVHCIIAQYVHSVDLPNYRLASKQFAEFGAPELFNAVTFHCSSRSTSRIKAIKACERLNKHVNTLTWDTNSWLVQGVRDWHEWQRYFADKQRLPSVPSMAVGQKLSTAQMKVLRNDRKAWEQYLDHVEDERATKTPTNLKNIFDGFANLHKLHVVNGHLMRAHRGTRKSSDFVYPLQPPPTYYRGESLYNYGRPIGAFQRPGGYAFAVIRGFQSMSWSLTKLRLDAICWSTFFAPGGEFFSLQGVTSLHLSITLRFDDHQQDYSTHDNGIHDLVRVHLRRSQKTLRRRHLMDFLTKLPKLRSLKLAFDGPFHEDCLLTMKPTMTTIHHIFSKKHMWPDLQKLALHNIGTTPDALLSLMRRQSGTLKTLGLHDINFEKSKPKVEWPETEMQPPHVFAEMQEMLCLNRAELSGYFGFGHVLGYEVWNLNEPALASATAQYLVEGGTCPLNHSNKQESKQEEITRLRARQ